MYREPLRNNLLRVVRLLLQHCNMDRVMASCVDEGEREQFKLMVNTLNHARVDTVFQIHHGLLLMLVPCMMRNTEIQRTLARGKC